MLAEWNMVNTDRLVRIVFLQITTLYFTFSLGCGGSGSSSSSTSPQNPVPSIDSLSPSSDTTCGSAFTLTVAGTNFIASSTVQWNGSNRATTYVSGSGLTASITASDVAVAGAASITVVNPAPGGGTSTAAKFNVACAIQISVDSQSQQLATINKDVFGANLPSSMDFTSSNGNLSATVSTFQSAHFGMVRWPLALLSDYYHWQTNSFSSCAQSAWGPLLSRTPFDAFMQNIAQPLGLDVNITVNYGSNVTCTGGGDPNEAAAWVDYANNQMHYGIKYWSIGNEQYYGGPTLGSTFSTPDFNVSSSDPPSQGSATYANLIATQFYPLMKAKDPSIQIGIDLVVPDNNVSDRTIPWDSTVLADAKFDFVEVHWYGASPANVAISDSNLLGSGDSYFVPAISQLKSELSAAGKANIPIFVGEWGIPGPNDGSPQDITIVGALYTALALGEMTKAGISMAGIWTGFDSGPCNTSATGYYSWQTWFTPSLFEAIAGGTNPVCPSIAQPSYGTALPRANAVNVVQAAFNSGDAVFAPVVSPALKSVEVYGTRRNSGYGLLLVNTDQNNAVTTAIGIANDTRSFTAKSLVYSKAQYDKSQNNVWSTPVPQSLGTVTGSFAITLPQWSVTAITLSTP